MKDTRKSLKLKMYNEIFNLKLIKSEYLNNWRIYLWLESKEWPFSDISINDPSLDTLSNEILINPDFEMCFKWTEEMRKRLEENIWIKSRWIHGRYHTFTY